MWPPALPERSRHARFDVEASSRSAKPAADVTTPTN
jgi:hypothetical protein